MPAFRWVQIIVGGNAYFDMVTVGRGSRTRSWILPLKSQAHSFKTKSV